MTVRELLDAIELQSGAVFCYYDYQKDERVVITEYQAAAFDIRYVYTDLDRDAKEMKIFIEVSVEEDDEIPENPASEKKFEMVMLQREDADVYASLDNLTGEHLVLRLSGGRTIEIPADGVTLLTYSEEDVDAANQIAYGEYKEI